MNERPPPPVELDWDRVREHFSLTPRELEIARLIFEGLPYKQIATRLGCSPYTVDSHRRRLYDKVGAHRRNRVLLRIVAVGLS